MPRSGFQSGEAGIECDVTLLAELVGATREDVATWDGATFSFSDAAGRELGRPQEVTAAEFREWWRPRSVRAGTRAEALLFFWATDQFRVDIELRYTLGADGEVRTARHEVGCFTAGPPLSGRYILSTINGLPLPAPAHAGMSTIVADTLEFFPNLTFTATDDHGKSELHGYRMISADTIELPFIYPNSGGLRHLVRSGTTLWYGSTPFGGLPGELWRFDLEGTAPPLPPPARLVASPAVVTIVASQGGALPAPIDLQVTEAAGRELLGFGYSTYWSCPAGEDQTPCKASVFLLEAARPAVPTTIRVSVLDTSLPPGVYRRMLVLTALGVPTIEVPLVYTVRAP
ncbi:MAG TPA: hypothetical protein VGE02_08310 [Gemmatimonadales bacterium]